MVGFCVAADGGVAASCAARRPTAGRRRARQLGGLVFAVTVGDGLDDELDGNFVNLLNGFVATLVERLLDGLQKGLLNFLECRERFGLDANDSLSSHIILSLSLKPTQLTQKCSRLKPGTLRWSLPMECK